MEKILLILVPGYTYLYIILFENTYIFIICHKKWNYSMLKNFLVKRRGRERLKLMIKSHGKVTYCHGKVMEIHYEISVGTLYSVQLDHSQMVCNLWSLSYQSLTIHTSI